VTSRMGTGKSITFIYSVSVALARPAKLRASNGNASEAKANEGFDNSNFFASEAKRTCSVEGYLLAKRSEHVRKK
jgi:hypothetical protein